MQITDFKIFAGHTSSLSIPNCIPIPLVSHCLHLSIHKPSLNASPHGKATRMGRIWMWRFSAYYVTSVKQCQWYCMFSALPYMSLCDGMLPKIHVEYLEPSKLHTIKALTMAGLKCAFWGLRWHSSYVEEVGKSRCYHFWWFNEQMRGRQTREMPR